MKEVSWVKPKPIRFSIVSVHSQEAVQEAAEHVITKQMALRGVVVTVEQDKTRRLYLTLESNVSGVDINADAFRDKLRTHAPGMSLLLLRFDESYEPQ